MKKKALVLMLMLLAAGCAGGGPPTVTQYYLIDYSPPVIRDAVRLDHSLKIERFSVAQLYNSTSMISRTGPYGMDKLPFDRWGANPGDMVTDYLTRDFRQSAILQAVFSYRATDTARFVLQGTVTEFAGVEEKDGRKAVLTLHVTLLDLSHTNIAKRVMFQRNYSYVASCKDGSAEGLAAGLSESLAHLSVEILNDVYAAAKSCT
ncbi:MAG TPA: ABC-type transport auxiliary lipoprotein family protein [Syntrophales bacterium]|nr:ABC-type transport auxiliary lipoprotein family protein [Syntrophales bacterium]